MLRNRMAALCGAMAAILASTPILLAAQDAAAQSVLGRGARTEQGQSREDREREARRRGGAAEEQDAPAATEMNPEEAKAGAQTALAAAGANCMVTEASYLGQTAEKAALFEAVCASGPGYLVLASTPPQAYDCVLLASQAEAARATDPNAETERTCALPANQNVDSVFATYARDAGVTCTVDDGLAIGRATSGATVYEIGCAGSDGYWIEQSGSGWTKTPCMQVMSQNKACRFTTVEEQVADVQKLLGTSDASDCTVAQFRLMGQNANGMFLEAKCNVEGKGYVARVQDGAVAQVYACPAPMIGGGCTLTTVSEDEPAEE